MAMNMPIQGTQADIIKIAMIQLESRLREADLPANILLQVHDELVLEIAPGELDAVRELVTLEMGRAADLLVPLDVQPGVGATWHEAAH